MTECNASNVILVGPWRNRSDLLATVLVDRKILSKMGGIEVTSGPNYYDAFGADCDFFRISLTDFLSQNSEFNEFGNLCSEAPLPKELCSLVKLEVPAKLKFIKEPYSMLHAGLKGAKTPIHYDWDFNWIINVSLSGSKRFLLLPPESSWLISPLHNISSLDIAGFDTEDRLEFLKSVGGTEIEVPEGHALMFPSIWWHGAIYDETSTAISIRFGGPIHLRPLAILPRHWLLQRIVWENWKTNDLEKYFGWVEIILRVFLDKKEFGWQERYTALQVLYRKWLLELGAKRGVKHLHGDQYNIEIALMHDDLAEYYQPLSNFESNLTDDHVNKTIGYIFAENCPIDHEVQEKAAKYALSVRQGLKPAKGLIVYDTIEDS